VTSTLSRAPWAPHVTSAYPRAHSLNEPDLERSGDDELEDEFDEEFEDDDFDDDDDWEEEFDEEFDELEDE
jgi:hypothetical protein